MNQNTLNFAKQLAIKLGKHIQSSRNRIEVTVQKDIVDICTNIDEEVEKIAVDAILKKFPSHNIHSEECGFIDNKSEYTWYLDPIDGTKEFYRNIPLYNTSLTLETQAGTLLGVSYHSVIKTLYSASKETKAKKNNIEISVNQNNDISKSFIYSTLPYAGISESEFSHTWKIFDKIAHKAYRIRSFADIIYSLDLVSDGSIDGYIGNTFLPVKANWHDLSAGLHLVERAGGKVTDIYGNAIINKDLSKGVVASNAKIHDELLKIIKN